MICVIQKYCAIAYYIYYLHVLYQRWWLKDVQSIKNIAAKFVATNDPIILIFPIFIGAHSQTEVSGRRLPNPLRGEWCSFSYNLCTMVQSVWGTSMSSSYAYDMQNVEITCWYQVSRSSTLGVIFHRLIPGPLLLRCTNFNPNMDK